jgi:tyrosyl-tRNA synthetase
MHELLYPLAQAMDCVAVKSDVEVGGTDQKFNFLVGRDIQSSYGLEPQAIITMELLEGTDGSEKMSKSLNNAICFTDTPKDIFGKTMSIPDSLIYKYFKLCTDISSKELAEIKSKLEDKNTNPRNLKVELGYELVKKYYDEQAAESAQKEFEKIFVKKEVPDDIEELVLHIDEIPSLAQFLAMAKLASSNAEARRLIEQGAVSIDGEKLTHPFTDMLKYVNKDIVIKVGKRKFLKVKIIPSA